MSNCKDCGREEWGFLSALDDDGYCYSCAAKHNKEKIERLQELLEEAIKSTKDQELIIKRLKRRRICDNQKTEARKEHINELIEQVKELKEEIARRGRLINELKTQRKEANEVIKKYAEFNNWEGDDKDQHDMTHFVGEDIGCGWSLTTDYLEKWGVK